MTDYIYVAESLSGRIKVGFTTNPVLRAQSLYFSNGDGARIIRLIHGTVRQEKELHSMLSPERIVSEWYHKGGKLIEHLLKRMPVYHGEGSQFRRRNKRNIFNGKA